MQLQGFSACSEARFKGGAEEGSWRATQTHPLLRATAKPDLATSLFGKAAEKLYAGLQRHGPKDGHGLDLSVQNRLGFANYVGQESVLVFQRKILPTAEKSASGRKNTL